MTSSEVGIESAVVVDQLTVVRGGTTALKGVSFALEPGTLTGLLGPSGAGKTTLMRAIVGVQIITAGTVTVLGRPAGVAALRDRVGYVTQDPSVYPDLSVRQNLRYFAKVLGAPSSDIDRVIEEVQLQPQAEQVVSTLSGGERSRVSLATALLGNPELLVLDEPTVGLDPVLRRELWDLFGRLAERGVTLLVSSHVMDEATRCHRLLLLRQAELLADGTLAQLQALTGQADPEQVFLHLIDNGVQGPPGGPSEGSAGWRRSRVRGEDAMNLHLTLATAQRVLAQIRHDHRTMALLVAVPSLLMTLLWWIYEGGRIFDQIGAPLLGIFPLVIMFLITSVTTLRERTSGTLERLMTMPIGRADFVVGYALALGFAALIQTSLVATYAIVVLDLQVAGPEWMLVGVSVLSAILGVTMGLASSSLARTEFQAVQFMPALIFPQFLLCGLLVPRELMPPAAEFISAFLPLSYAVDAVKEVARFPDPTIGWEVAIIGVFIVGLLALGVTTLKRRSA